MVNERDEIKETASINPEPETPLAQWTLLTQVMSAAKGAEYLVEVCMICPVDGRLPRAPDQIYTATLCEGHLRAQMAAVSAFKSARRSGSSLASLTTILKDTFRYY